MIGRALRNNTSIVFVSAITSNALRLLSTIVLTHLLMPEAFGIMGIILSISFTVSMLADAGMYSFIIRSDVSDQRLMDAIWSARLVRSLIIAALVALTGPAISIYSGKDITLEIAIFSTSLAIDGFSSLAFATAVKGNEQIRVSALEIIPQTVGLGISIALAMLLKSHWALIATAIAVSFAKTVLSYKLFDQSSRRFRFDLKVVRDLWAYGKAIVFSSSLQAGISQGDKFVLVRFFSLSEFGLYNIAVSLISAIRLALNMYSKRVLYPAYVKAVDLSPALLSGTYYRIGLPFRMAYMVGAGGVITSSQAIIVLIYDESYRGAAQFLSILATTLLVSLSCNSTIELWLAQGRTGQVLYMNLVRALTLVLASITLTGWLGPIGIVFAVAMMEFAAQAYCWISLAKSEILQLRYELAAWAAGLGGMLAGALANRVITSLL